MGFTGLLIAAFFGFLLPGGPITIYPVAGAFLVMGADAGAVVAFIVSWTLIGYTRALVWELPFFGSDFVIWRIVEALPLPIIAGLLARIVVRAGFEYREGINDTRHQRPVVAGGRRSGILSPPCAGAYCLMMARAPA